MIEIKRSIATGWGTGGLYDILKQLQNMAVPMTQTQVYYVSKGGNNVDGLSWETAFTTIEAAITAQRAMRADKPSAEQSVNTYIIIAPGTYDENITTFAFSTTFIGLGVPGTDKACEWHTTTGACMAGTVSGMRLVNIRFEAGGANDLLDFNICNNVEILNCDFQANQNNVSAISTENSGYLTVKNCRFGTGLTYNFDYAIYAAGGADKYLHQAVIENNWINGLEATGTGIYIASNCTASGTLIKDNIIHLSGAGKGIDDDSDQAICIGNYVFHNGGDAYDFNANLAADNWDNNAGTLVDEPSMG